MSIDIEALHTLNSTIQEFMEWQETVIREYHLAKRLIEKNYSFILSKKLNNKAEEYKTFALAALCKKFDEDNKKIQDAIQSSINEMISGE